MSVKLVDLRACRETLSKTGTPVASSRIIDMYLCPVFFAQVATVKDKGMAAFQQDPPGVINTNGCLILVSWITEFLSQSIT